MDVHTMPPHGGQGLVKKAIIICGVVLAMIAVGLIVYYSRKSSTRLTVPPPSNLQRRDRASFETDNKDLIEILSELPESKFESAASAHDAFTPDQWEQLSNVPPKDLLYASKLFKTAYSLAPVIKAHSILNSSKAILTEDEVNFAAKSIKEKEAELKKFPGNDAKIEAFKKTHAEEFTGQLEHSSEDESDSDDRHLPLIEPSEAFKKAKSLLEALKAGSKKLYKDLTKEEVNLLVALDLKFLDTEEMKQLVLGLQNDHKLVTKFNKILSDKQLPLPVKDVKRIHDALEKKDNLGLESEEVTKAELMERMNELMEKASTLDETDLSRTYKDLIDEVLADESGLVALITKPAVLQELKSKMTPTVDVAQVREVLQRNLDNCVLSVADSNTLDGLNNKRMESIGLSTEERTKVTKLQQNTSTYLALLRFVRQPTVENRTLYKLMSVSANAQAKAILEGMDPSFDMQIFPNDNAEREQISKLKEYLPVHRSLEALGVATDATSELNTKVTLPTSVPMDKLTEAIANFGYDPNYQQNLRDLKVRVENASSLQQFLNQPANRTIDVISNSTNTAHYELLKSMKDAQFNELFQGSAVRADIGTLRDKVKARSNVLTVVTGKIGTELLSNADYAILTTNEALLDNLALNDADNHLNKSKELIKNNREHRALLVFASKPDAERTLGKLLFSGDALKRLESTTDAGIASWQISTAQERNKIEKLKEWLTVHQILVGLGASIDIKITLPAGVTVDQLNYAADNFEYEDPIFLTRVKNYRDRVLDGIDLKNLLTPSSGVVPSMATVVGSPFYGFFEQLSLNASQFDELFPNGSPSRSAIAALRDKVKARHDVLAVIAGKTGTELLSVADFNVLNTNENDIRTNELALAPENVTMCEFLIMFNEDHHALLAFVDQPDPADTTICKLMTNASALNRLRGISLSDPIPNIWHIDQSKCDKIILLKKQLVIYDFLDGLGASLDTKVTLPHGISEIQLKDAIDNFGYEDPIFLTQVQKYRERVLKGMELKSLLIPSSGVFPSMATIVRSSSYDFFKQLTPFQFNELFPLGSRSRVAIEDLRVNLNLREEIIALINGSTITTVLSHENLIKLISSDLIGLDLTNEQRGKCDQLIEFTLGHNALVSFIHEPIEENRTLGKLMRDSTNADAWTQLNRLSDMTSANLNTYLNGYVEQDRIIISDLMCHLSIHQTLDVLCDRIDNMVTVPSGISSVEDLFIASSTFGYDPKRQEQLLKLIDRIVKANGLKEFLENPTNRSINVIPNNVALYNFLNGLEEVQIQDIYHDDMAIANDVKELRRIIRSRESFLKISRKSEGARTADEKATLERDKVNMDAWNVKPLDLLSEYETHVIKLNESLDNFKEGANFSKVFDDISYHYKLAKALSPPDYVGNYGDDVCAMVLRHLNDKINYKVDDGSFIQWYPCLHYVSSLTPENGPRDVQAIRAIFIRFQEEAFARIYCKDVTPEVADEVRIVINRYMDGLLPPKASSQDVLRKLRLVRDNSPYRPILREKVDEPIRAIDPDTSMQLYNEKLQVFFNNPDKSTFNILHSLHSYNGFPGTFLDYHYKQLNERYKKFDLKEFDKYGRALVFLGNLKHKDNKTFEDLARSHFTILLDIVKSQLSPLGLKPVNPKTLSFCFKRLNYLNQLTVEYEDEYGPPKDLPNGISIINWICNEFIDGIGQEFQKELVALSKSYSESGKFDTNVHLRVKNLIDKSNYLIEHSTNEPSKNALRSFLGSAPTPESLLSTYIEGQYFGCFIEAMSTGDRNKCDAQLRTLNAKQPKSLDKSGLNFTPEYTKAVILNNVGDVKQIKEAYWPKFKHQMFIYLWTSLANDSSQSSLKCVEAMVFGLGNYDQLDTDTTLIRFKFSNDLVDMNTRLRQFLAKELIFQSFIDRFVGNTSLCLLPSAHFKGLYDDIFSKISGLLRMATESIKLDGVSIPVVCSQDHFAKLIVEKFFVQKLWKDASFQPDMKELQPKLELLDNSMAGDNLVKWHLITGLFDCLLEESPADNKSVWGNTVKNFQRVKRVILSQDDSDDKLSMLGLALKYERDPRMRALRFARDLQLGDAASLLRYIELADNRLIVGWIIAMIDYDRLDPTKKFQRIYHLQCLDCNMDLFDSYLEKLLFSKLDKKELKLLGLLLIDLINVKGLDKKEQEQDKFIIECALDMCKCEKVHRSDNIIAVFNQIREILGISAPPLILKIDSTTAPPEYDRVEMVCLGSGIEKPIILVDAVVNERTHSPIGIMNKPPSPDYTGYYFQYYLDHKPIMKTITLKL